MSATHKIDMPEAPGELDAYYAVEFLKALDPNGWHNLVAIELTSRDPISRTFKPGDWSGMEKFIERHNGKANLYFSVNEPKPGSGHKKLKRGDIAAARAVKVDLDPGKGEDLVDYRKASLEKIRGAAEPPTFIIDSGGGVQAFWKLQEKLPIEDGKWLYALNEAACNVLSGDVAVKNIDRIMRLPHTLNLPTPSKLKKHPNRQPRMATVISSDGPAIDRQKLEAAFPPVVREKKREVVAGPQPDLTSIESALTAIPNNDMEYGPWIRLLHVVWAAVGDQKAEGFDLFERWSARSDKHNLEDMTTWWDSINEVRELTARTLFYEARKHGWAEDLSADFEIVEGIDLLPDAANDNGPAKEKAPRFLLESWDDLLAHPKPKWLVRNWVPENGIGIVYGKWGTFKTFVVNDLILTLAYGMPDWHGAELPPGPSKVLVISREGGAGFAARNEAFRRLHGFAATTDNVRYMRQPVNFMETVDFRDFIAELRRFKGVFQLVVIDTVARVMAGVDMGTPESVTLFMERCLRISEVVGCAVIAVHHQNKSGGMMGSVYFEANSDFVFELKRPDGAGSLQASITCTKQKDGEDGWTRAVEMKKMAWAAGDEDESSLAVAKITTGGKTSSRVKRISNGKAEVFLDVLEDAVRAGAGGLTWEEWQTARCRFTSPEWAPGDDLPPECSEKTLAAHRKSLLEHEHVVKQRDGRFWPLALIEEAA